MKNSIKADARKNMILDIAENLFIEKGYEHTTINDVLFTSGIAKGSLYYYFKSKEDVLDGIIKRRGDEYMESASAITKADGINALEKLIRVMLTLSPKDERQKKLTDDLEKSSNGQLFIKSLTDIVLRLAPIVSDIIEQGIAEGVFKTPYPLESAEILLAAAHALFDNRNANQGLPTLKKTRQTARSVIFWMYDQTHPINRTILRRLSSL